MVTIDSLNRALRRVHRELDAVGLWDGKLEKIEVVLSYLPSGLWGECGFVYDRGVGGLAALAGFREGVIYVPFNAPVSRRRGETLRDVLRHEYGHALAWLRPSFVRGTWFRETFGAAYDEEWRARPVFDEREYVSSYSTMRAKEDFAETFATWLRGDARFDGVGNKVSAINARARKGGGR
jgi:hypothetical protein